MKVIRECGRARNAQGWRKLGPRGLCGNSNLGQPPYIMYEQHVFSLIWDQIIFVPVYLVYCAVEELNFFSSCCGKRHKSRLKCIYVFKNDECFIHNMSNIQIVYKCIVVPWRKHVGAKPHKISPLHSKSNMIYILQTRYTLATQGL